METERAKPTFASAASEQGTWLILVGRESDGSSTVWEFETWGDWVVMVRNDPPPF